MIVVFLIICLFVIIIPGFALVNKLLLNLDALEKFTLSATVGLVIFTLAAYMLAAVNLRFLMYIFPLAGGFFLFKYKCQLLNFKPELKNKNVFLLVFLLGIIAQVAVNAPSGIRYADGVYFWSSHGHDGIWHLALMESLTKESFPFQNPELAGAKLQNYHFFVDLLMSEFHRLFYFSNLDIYFRFMPVLFSVLLGLSSFILVRAWGKSETAGIWAMFFTYFAGSFGYLIYIPTHKSLGGESIFWVSQTHSVLGNPPHASAFIILTAFLFCFLKYLQEPKRSLFILCALLGGVVIEFKVYAGVLILLGLLVTGVFQLLLKRSINCIMLFATCLIIALIVYLPNSANSQDFLLWQPWWFIRTMVVAPDRLNWLDLELKRQTYLSEHNFKRVIQLEITAFFIFLFGNLGMRFLGFWSLFKLAKQNFFKNLFTLFFTTVSVASFFIPVFFLQKGVAWNAIQFNQYFLLFFGFLAGLATTDIISRLSSKSAKAILALMIVLLAIPTQLGLLWQFYSNKPLSKVSYAEIAALDFLGKQPQGKVMVAPFNKYEKDKFPNPPIPIYAWYDTGYVPAFSGQKTLISDEEQINIVGYDVKDLLRERKDAFENKDPQRVNNFLKQYKIEYVYLTGDENFAAPGEKLTLQEIFKNNDARIYKVK